MTDAERAPAWDAGLASVPIAPTRPAYRVAKRALDLAGAGIGLVVASPVMLGVALAIRSESGGPVLFRQQRVGLGGRPFQLYKFRTMHASADEEAHRRYVRTLIGGEAAGETGPAAGDAATAGATWVPIETDPRVTGVGRFLRRTHLDELPQLLNVLRGEMSLVGPRPPIPYEVELYEPWHLRRLSVVPGLTGLWQVRGWGRLSFDEGVALDLVYIEQRSFVGDIGIILRTVWQILTGRQF
ncbi:MAG TPA: sugar transferase [Candidatus Limnocylindria bacterium]|nr:sugar transferase [Candidatus Limnocylindria bacterium]